MNNFLSVEERQLIERTKLELKSELRRLSFKINNFIALEILLFFVSLIAVYHQFWILGNIKTSIIIFTISLILQFILIQATRVALYNWKSNKSLLISYESDPDEFYRKFIEYIDSEKRKE